MHLRHLKTLHLASDAPITADSRLPRVTSISCSANNLRTAVATSDRFITLYDEDGTQKDRFPTKSSVSGNKSYSVKSLAFSPDSQRLAVAQSDNIVFVYKLGRSWSDKKTICNKYPSPCAVTAACWPASRANDLVFGGSDGKVRIGNSANKTSTLYATDSYVLTLVSGIDGLSFVSGHIDGSIIKYAFPKNDGQPASHSLLTRLKFAPSAIAVTNDHIIVAGNAPQVLVYDHAGQQLQKFDYSRDSSVREFTGAVVHPSGQTVIFANYDKYYVYVLNMQSRRWEEGKHIPVANLYSVTALCWKGDGTRLYSGSILGAVDCYDACLKKYIYKHDYEITYTSLSSIVIRHLTNNQKCSIVSKYNLDIGSLSIHRQQYVLARTSETMILGDLLSGQQSEISWNPSHASTKDKERFSWDSDHCCLIYYGGELHVIEYGIDEIVASVRTEFASSHLMSLRINEARNSSEGDVRKLAYLLDHQTVRVANLAPRTTPVHGQKVVPYGAGNASIISHYNPVNDLTLMHDHRIDWLELNGRGTKLLFRDKQRSLHLFDIVTQRKHILLHYTTYVQWVPNSDVVVAQSRKQLYVWYSIDAMSDVTMIPINGEVEAIHRVSGKTEVIIDEGNRKSSINLDEPLIAFGSAIDAHDFDNAVKILESFDSANTKDYTCTSRPTSGQGAAIDSGSDLTAMWQQLSRIAMNEKNYLIAERCFAALGDVSNTQYLHEINSIIANNNNDASHWLVQAMICLINKQFKRAETLYLNNGGIDALIEMYRSMHKWSDALRIAEQRQHPLLKSIRQDYFRYLTATRQESLAGELKEKEGDFDTALTLYLKGGLASKAADLILSQGLHSNASLCDKVSASLINQRQYEKAGDFLFELGQHKRSLDCYVKGHCYHRAVELARREFPSQVVSLEEQWGDWLFQQQQFDAACQHFIQCGQSLKALESAIEAKQWNKAQSMYEGLDPNTAKPFAKRIATQLASVGQYSEAERFYIAGGSPSDAVSMYSGAGLWDKAHSIAITYMSETEVRSLYVSQALKYESSGQYKEAEKLYVTVKEIDSAIAMYRKHRLYDDMTRLIGLYRKESLTENHFHLGHQFETEGNFKQAETHYVAAKEWKACYTMYKEQQQWEDALRVAKNHGGQQAYKQAAYEFAMAVGGEAGIKMLVKRGLAELAVDVAVERAEFDQAFTIAEKACKSKLLEIHYAYAMKLEDDGKFEAAEREFISARKPKEAIDMWIHQQQWEAAERVANDFETSAINEIVEAHAKQMKDNKEFKQAEALLVQSKKAADAVRMYCEQGMWDDALRVAKQHAPRLVQQVQNDRTQHMASTSHSDTMDYYLNQAKLAIAKKQYSAAIDFYLSIDNNKCKDINLLEQHWEQAFDLAHDEVKTRLSEVTSTICQRLLALERYESASQFFVDSHQYQQAIDALMKGKDWDKAKAVAQAHAPHLLQSIQQQQNSHLLSNNNLQSLAEVSPDVAIDAYANSGEWDKVYLLAAKQGEAMTHKYASIHAASLLKANKSRSAVRVFLEHGCPILPANFPLYKRIASEVLSLAGDVENPSVSAKRHNAIDSFSSHSQSVINELRDMLFGLLRELHSIDPTGSPLTQELDKLLLITHYVALRFLAHSNDLSGVVNKLSLSLLRYTQVLPVDKQFYDAGVSSRECSDPSSAFVLFNRFIDVTDLMSDPDSGDIDNSDFLETDIPSPFDTPLPPQQYYSDEVREEIREWVLEKAMSHDINQALHTRQCEKCATQTYEAALKCHRCQYQYEPCIVTGFPIIRSRRVQCSKCQKGANRDDWNKLVARTKCCPWCRGAANPVY